MKLPLPPLVPLGLALLVDGEPAAAEFCAKTAHTKLLPRLHALQAPPRRSGLARADARMKKMAE